jgi:hypothetical protein
MTPHQAKSYSGQSVTASQFPAYSQSAFEYGL